MRTLIYNSLLVTPGLADVNGRIYQRGSLGVGDVPASPVKPYLVMGELSPVIHPEVRDTARTVSHMFQFHAYDERGSFIRIERLLYAVRETVLGLVTVVSPTGARCTDAEWTDVSGDLSDAQLDANVKFIIMRVTANK